MSAQLPIENHPQTTHSAQTDLFQVVNDWNERHPEPLTTREVLGQIALEQEQQAHKNTKEQLTTDELTGLHNRLSYDHKLQETLSEHFAFGEVEVYPVDLDGFKSLNDRLGHDVADEALAEIGVQFSTLESAEDDDGAEYFVARTGGDEFMIIKKQRGVTTPTPQSLDRGCSEIEEFVQAANETIEHRINENSGYKERRRIGLGASVGVVVPRPGQTYEQVVAEYEMTLADKKTANKLLPSAELRSQMRQNLVEDDQEFDAFRGMILDEHGDEKGFIENCRRYSDAAKQEVLDKLVIPKNQRKILDTVYGDLHIPVPKILDRIEFIQGRALTGYADLSDAIPEEADELKEYYLGKSQDFSNELEGLLIDLLALYRDKTQVVSA